MIYTVTLNPALDRTVQIECFAVGKLNRIQTSRTDPGGKGINVSRTLDVFHCPTVTMGVLGGHNGDIIASHLKESGFRCDFIWTDAETRTNLKIVDTIMGVNTEINSPGNPVGAEALEQVRSRLMHTLEPGDIVIFSGSLPPDAPAELYRDWIRECKEIGATVFLDTAGYALALAVEAAPYCIKPNRMELQAIVGYQLPTIQDVAQAGWQLLGKGITLVAASLGAEGALLISRKKVLHAVAPQIQPKSEVGAGDTLLAALVYSHQEGLSYEDSLKMAVAASAAKVMRTGTEPPAMADIQALLKQVIVEEL